MTKLYDEYLLGRSCIIAEQRENRPFIEHEKEKCPFCLGNEHMLENIWLDYPLESDKEIGIRVVNNKYPLCNKQSYLYGIHDVVIDTLRHESNPNEYSREHWKSILLVIQHRWNQLRMDTRINFIQVFKNHGKKAGASIAHSHWQIVALEELPYTMQNEYKRSEKKCSICEMIEVMDENYIVEKFNNWLVMVPKTPQMMYEIWIIPLKHRSNYEEFEEEVLGDLGEVMSKVIKGYNQLKKDISYNICFMSERPRRQSNYHFYIKIIPRESNFGGFELATGCSISTVDPIRYAKELAGCINKK